MQTKSLLVLSSLFCAGLTLGGCGPSSDNGAGAGGPVGPGGVDGGGVPEFSLSTLRGTVWVPGNAPGMVAAGNEIPVFDALVYLSASRPPPMQEGATCRPCAQAPANAAQSDHKGVFVLEQVPKGDYWLVVEKGDFRLESQITVSSGSSVALNATLTTLPSVSDVSNGKTIPNIALASGSYDDLEDILGKMAMGSVDSAGTFEGPSASGIFDFYSNGGSNDGQAVGTLGSLVSDLATMMRYDIIFIPCSREVNTDVLRTPQALRNIRDYVAGGGKLYVTDWSGEWADNVFPEEIQLSAGADTPASAYDDATGTWNISQFGDADGFPSYTSEHAEAANEDLRLWLDGQQGPYANGGTGVFNASDMVVEGNWNHIEGLHSKQVGVDANGMPIMDNPVKYVVGDDSFSGPKKPLTVTFEPAGCGRVLYSTYHTTETEHVGMAPQERVLLYLIMEIGVCKNDIIID